MLAGGCAWLAGVMRGCQGACVVAGRGACMVADGGHAWLPGACVVAGRGHA